MKFDHPLQEKAEIGSLRAEGIGPSFFGSGSIERIPGQVILAKKGKQMIKVNIFSLEWKDNFREKV